MDDYAKGAQQISAVRADAIAAAGGGTEAAAKIAKLNEEAIRIAREVTLPIATELEPLANEIADFAKHSVQVQAAEAAREMATAEWESLALGLATILLADCDQHLLLLHDRASHACVERVDGRTCRRQFRGGAAGTWPQG